MQLTVSNYDIRHRIIYFFVIYRRNIVLTVIVSILLMSSMTFCKQGLLEYAERMANEMCSFSNFDKIRSELELTIEMDDMNIGGMRIAGLGRVLNEINGIVEGFAVTLCVLMWLISFGTTLMNTPNPGFELIIKRFFILVISMAILGNAMQISTAIGNAGTGIVNAIGANIGSEDVSIDMIIADMESQVELAGEEGAEIMENEENDSLVDDDAGWGVKILDKIRLGINGIFTLIFKLLHQIMKVLGMILALLMPYFFLKIASALCTLFTLSRSIELVALCVLSPIPAAIILNDPFGSGAFSRFIRNLSALALQGAVMLLVAFICQSMFNGILAGTTSYDELTVNSWKLVGIGLAEVGLLAKSLGIAQKAVGLS